MTVEIEIEGLSKGNCQILSCTLLTARVIPETPYQFILDCIDSGLEVEIVT